ncbi:nitroreductase [Lucifera butyrica]|uniref:Nitroreductase n=1 Tax=Lucifera butyrica TaxID=1351585 RepID=A0A498RH27_9FIRM|nr:nitroreductase family protein [Lucifera butyrica]VBB08438.1 nitroreductase [Lucifera butyrica]
MTNEVLETIKRRRSIRSFKEEQIKDEELQAIIEAGRYAPSAMNQQCWHFTVVQNKEILEMLNARAKKAAAEIDNEHIQQMAKNENFNIFYGAPTVVIISGDEAALLIDADCAAAAQNMLLAAESVGLGSCWVNFVVFAFQGDESLRLKQQLGIPEGFRPFYSVVLGYKKVERTNVPAKKETVVNYVK